MPPADDATDVTPPSEPVEDIATNEATDNEAENTESVAPVEESPFPPTPWRFTLVTGGSIDIPYFEINLDTFG